jgi:hypothetical protein
MLKPLIHSLTGKITVLLATVSFCNAELDRLRKLERSRYPHGKDRRGQSPELLEIAASLLEANQVIDETKVLLTAIKSQLEKRCADCDI